MLSAATYCCCCARAGRLDSDKSYPSCVRPPFPPLMGIEGLAAPSQGGVPVGSTTYLLLIVWFSLVTYRADPGRFVWAWGYRVLGRGTDGIIIFNNSNGGTQTHDPFGLPTCSTDVVSKLLSTAAHGCSGWDLDPGLGLSRIAIIKLRVLSCFKLYIHSPPFDDGCRGMA